MRTTIHLGHAAGARAGRVRTLLFTVLLVAALGAPLSPAAGSSAGGPAGGAASGGQGGTMGAAGGSPDAGRSHQVTLLTGDVVVLHRSPDGQQAAWVSDPAGDPDTERPAHIYEQDGKVHVVPAEAAPYLSSGVLDENLFNVTGLVRQGYHDEAAKELPLLVQAAEGPAAKRAPRLPAAARRVRELDSIGAVSIVAPKSRVRSVWEALRGTPAASVDATDAQLAGGGKVWLDGRVQAMLEDSVPQVGAPAAWAAGYDGEGAQVAVLDTGYDPGHPDLAGRVVETENFTAEDDPEGETAVDGNGHGTHVAATVAGSGAASGGARKGVAPGADLLIGKVLDSAGSGTMGQLIAGMEWSAHSGADVVNMSLGTPFPSDGTDPLSQAVDELTESTRTLFVVAAGNAGPADETVTAPGAADLALTVGAVTKEDAAASFSSRGPRAGDGALKPEIVAPGAGIVAARADGTSLGNLLDEHYTSMSGTSMATPHVAGAAAILAQRHEDWDAAALKSRLVQTSKTLEGEPVTFQGGGRLDVEAAAAESLTVDTGVLSLGHIAHGADPVTRTLTFTNPTEETIRLLLSAEVTGTGDEGKQRPWLTFDRRVLHVPAGGEASTQVRLDPDRTEPGAYAGQVVARVFGGTGDVHTATSFTVDGPLRTVTVNAVDRDGEPASGFVDLWSAETGDPRRIWFDQGTASTRLSDGLYAMVAGIQPSGSRFRSVDYTFAGDPELRVRGDVSLDLDAREGRAIDIETDKRADLHDLTMKWHRSVGRRSYTSQLTSGYHGQGMYLIPSKKAQTGSFEFATQWQLVEPLMRLRTLGEGGGVVQPNPRLASPGAPFVGDATLPLVYAGDGTREDFAEVDARDKVALVTRAGQGMEKQMHAAQEAGVAALLVHNDVDDVWTTSVWGQDLPTYRLDLAAGISLREQLADRPDLRVQLSGLRDSTYSYELAFVDDMIPRGPTYDTSELPLATVTSDYRQNSERMSNLEAWVPYIGSTGIGDALMLRRNGPVERTEYVSTEDVDWQRLAQPHGEFPGYYWTWSAVHDFAPGDEHAQVWWGPLVHPAVLADYAPAGLGSPVARFRDAIRIMMPHYSYGGSLHGTIANQFGDTSEVTLRRGGEVIGKAPWPQAQFTVPEDEAEYELELEVTNGSGNFVDTSVRTDTTWRFRSVRSGQERTVLPLLQLDYHLETNSYNEVPAGDSYPLRLETGYQPEADGPGDFTATVEVSYDDGQTWQDVEVSEVDGALEAEMPAAPAGSAFASVRVDVTDAAGNEIEQQIDRAWRLGD